jgi:hypothetical protein
MLLQSYEVSWISFTLRPLYPKKSSTDWFVQANYRRRAGESNPGRRSASFRVADSATSAHKTTTGAAS